MYKMYKYSINSIEKWLLKIKKQEMLYCFMEEHLDIEHFVCEFKVIPLNEMELQLLADNYKTDNGKYFDKGVSISYGKLLDRLEQEYCNLELRVSECGTYEIEIPEVKDLCGE